MIGQKKYIYFIEMYKKPSYPDLQNGQKFRDRQESWLKVKKDEEQHKNTIIKLKGTVAKFHKFSITFWANAVLQPKNKQKSAAATINKYN